MQKPVSLAEAKQSLAILKQVMATHNLNLPSKEACLIISNLIGGLETTVAIIERLENEIKLMKSFDNKNAGSHAVN